MKYDSQNAANHLIGERLPGRTWLFLGATGSLIFLLYGSLVPLDYEYKSLNEAWTVFKALPFKGLHVSSRADLGANFLLMVPIGFFGMGFLWPSGRRIWAIFLAITVWIICFGFSCVIEFAQNFFRGRTPSFSDILMQAIGSSAGIIAWWLWGRKLWTRYFQTAFSAMSMNIAEKFLWVYLIALFGYNVVPFGLTINPIVIYQKFKAGRIILIPFGFGYSNFIEFVYAIATDVAIWIPAGFLWVLSGKKRPLKAWLWTVTAGIVVEVSQIFIVSRIFDITDILTGALGGGIGVLLCLKMPLSSEVSPRPHVQTDSLYKQTWVGFGLFCVWCLIVALVFWFPYEVQIERKFIGNQLDRFFQVPFYVYYQSSELQAITAVFQKTLFFAPLGVFLAIAARPFSKTGVNSLLALIALSFCIGAGLAIELGQVIMPNKIPDSTDLLLETMGGMLGFVITRLIIRRMDHIQLDKTRIPF